jgi:6,7-dimethyl-8-ribityllumazine synthase
MPAEVPPGHVAAGARFGIVAARWNEAIVRRLVDGALGALAARGVGGERVVVWWVPGAYELPLAARWLIDREAVAAVLAFGCVIRGETEHFRLVADASSDGLMRVMLDTRVPVLNGVLAVERADQAEARAGGVMGNRGAEVALAGIAMAALSGRASAPGGGR